MRLAVLRRIGLQKNAVGLALYEFFISHIFAVAGTLRVPLSQPQKRRIQPDRYATLKV